jgi:hypothetical protein
MQLLVRTRRMVPLKAGVAAGFDDLMRTQT